MVRCRGWHRRQKQHGTPFTAPRSVANRVARLASLAGITAQIGYRRRPGRYGAKPAVVADNTLDRQFEVDAPDRVWVTDITYIKTYEGGLDLGAIDGIGPCQRNGRPIRRCGLTERPAGLPEGPREKALPGARSRRSGQPLQAGERLQARRAWGDGRLRPALPARSQRQSAPR